jgi:dolichol-phosphate mannosyltransferase
VNKILVFIPTYNEAENIQPLYKEIKALGLKTDILFVDDNSPDGTGDIINSITLKDKSVKLKKRLKKEGIGSAHFYGINYAYKNRYKMLITLDADFTHKPKDILNLMKAGTDADIIVGSRYLSRGSLSEWNMLRKVLTITAHVLTKRLLGMPYDATGAFRLYNLDKIPQGIFKLIESKGYSFFFESLFILFVNKISIKEVPIKLPARTYGSSKMRIGDALKSLRFLIQTFYLSTIYKDSYTYIKNEIKSGKLNVYGEDEWDEYWKAERKNRKVLYDTAATFYRKFIIKRSLNYHIKKNFNKNDTLLHAGCGGGQVDEDLVNYARITALDISREALNRYRWAYGSKCKTVHGSIFDIPAKRETFDGIYNLGVMEHFTKKDINKILDEFNRVLKKGGKILLFWPPSYGFSVLFLNSMHFILNDILNKNIRLHPEEITKVSSKKQIEGILSKSNFKLKGFHFGPSDLFTYVVVVGEKSN